MKRISSVVVMVSVLLCGCMAAAPRRAIVAAPVVQQALVLTPLGDWPLCRAGIRMPGCATDSPILYLAMGSGVVTVTLAAGGNVTKRVTNYEILDFGGIIASYVVEGR